jgi:hypothetical protein
MDRVLKLPQLPHVLLRGGTPTIQYIPLTAIPTIPAKPTNGAHSAINDAEIAERTDGGAALE